MRLFIATTFPESVLRDVNERVAKIKPRLPSASWVRLETQHLTLAFLGEQDQSLIDRITPALEKRLGSMKKFTASIAGAGFFPNPRRARVGWMGLDPAQPFCEMASAARDVATKNQVELDRADFRPHLTLMRLRDAWPPASIETFEKALRDYRSAPFAVDTVTIFSSSLHPDGAIHTPLRQIALA